MKTLTVKFNNQDISDGITRAWYTINGTHQGTGIEFENEIWAKCSDGSILDCDGCPWECESDDTYVAVEDSIDEFETETKKQVAEITEYAESRPAGEMFPGIYVGEIGPYHVQVINTHDGQKPKIMKVADFHTRYLTDDISALDWSDEDDC
jgi:hypothetical protein